MDWMTDKLGPFGPWIFVGGLGLLLVLLTLPTLLNRPEDPLDKLKRSQQSDTKNLIEATKLRQKRGTDKLDKFSNFLEPKDEAEYTAVQLKLLQAGYRTKSAVSLYHFAQFALGILGLVLGVVYTLYLSQTAAPGAEPTTQNLILYTLIPGAAGYMLPKYWVNKRQKERQTEITNGFPDSLDMMLVCVEAGQSLDQAIIRVARELKAGFPALAWEYELVAYEMKAGKDKLAVLKDMSERCGVPDVSSFVTVLIQSQQFGTSIADALRVYASEMRDKRVMRAEEKANILPTKMTLATMMLTVPPLLIILIGPSVYNIYENLVLGVQ
ncbi:type II secretion system F family protein [Histidinibacterium aquaticum]|nr:type II secretion system F family protein [Histidinibacterium aquaticum]